MTYKPEQMEEQAKHHDQYAPETAAMLRQGADAVRKLEDRKCPFMNAEESPDA